MIREAFAAAMVGALALPALAETRPGESAPERLELDRRAQVERLLQERANMLLQPAEGNVFVPAQLQVEPRKEKAAYLGVMAAPASPTLREQLRLPRGIGLAVEFIDKESPAAAAGLAQHDVVTKLDDQWLVSLQQLAILVRMHKPGDTVKVTYLRGGESKTVDVKLVEKEVPVLEEESRPMRAPFFVPGGGMGGPRGDLLVPRQDMEGGPAWTPAQRVSVKIEDGVITKSLGDGEHTLILRTDKDGKKTLSAESVKDKKVVFSGPIDSDEERKKVPAEVAEKLKRLEGATGGRPLDGTFLGMFTRTRADEEHTMTLNHYSKSKTLVVRDKEGKVIFDGPVSTEEERKKVPAEILKKLERMEKVGKE